MKFNNIIQKVGLFVCSFAFMVAINSIGNMCIGTGYQPKAPKSMDKYR